MPATIDRCTCTAGIILLSLAAACSGSKDATGGSGGMAAGGAISGGAAGPVLAGGAAGAGGTGASGDVPGTGSAVTSVIPAAGNWGDDRCGVWFSVTLVGSTVPTIQGLTYKCGTALGAFQGGPVKNGVFQSGQVRVTFVSEGKASVSAAGCEFTASLGADRCSPSASGKVGQAGGCADALTNCSAICSDTTSDVKNCGGCGKTCGTGLLCTASACSCPAPQKQCLGACVDTQSNQNHCGDCNHPCQSGLACIAGACVCPSPRTMCSDACVDTNDDKANCGACGTACAAAETCDNGKCVACPGTGGPAMVGLPGGYCIDSTEVTHAQYEAWLATNPDLALQDQKDCAWNTSFAADASCMALGCTGTKCADKPQECVDWCDARAYCASVGKHLCGKIGGGAVDYAKFADATTDQWYRACTSNGANQYPYGNSYDSKACNGDQGFFSGAARAVATVASFPRCQSTLAAYAGIYDLSGNLEEWEDACDGTGPTAHCRIRGGLFMEPNTSYTAQNLRCDHAGSTLRNAVYSFMGFRCCAR